MNLESDISMYFLPSRMRGEETWTKLPEFLNMVPVDFFEFTSSTRREVFFYIYYRDLNTVIYINLSGLA